jgi:hypothetical protein
MTIIQTLAVKGFTTKLEGGRLAITPKANLTNSLREFIRANKTKLVSELQAEKQAALVSSAFVSGHSRESLKTNDDLAQFEADTFHAVLNRLIEAGVMFEVSTEDFQTIDPANALKISDKEFLKLNDAAILCQLQQSLLMKHIFSHSPEQFEDFAFEVREREAIYAADYLKKPVRITAETLTADFYFAAVSDVSKKWYGELLNQRRTNERTIYNDVL